MPIINIGLDISGLRSGATQATATLNGISVSASQAQQATNQLSSAIASAAKQVLVLVGAYKALDGIKGFAQRGIEFNSSMESSQIAIATAITSMSNLSDAQGNLLTGTEKYAAAQQFAADMMKQIQLMGLETTATTTELVEGVQNVMGTALQAGLRIEQIPRFTVGAMQAMQTLAIPLEQTRTELEALLSGNINKAQDLLAPRLGIDKETLDSWKQQGILFEELMKKFEPFNIAGKDVAQTWRGLTSNLKEAMDIISGQSAAGLSENLKESVRDLQSLFITSKDGTVSISKDFENIAAVVERVQTAIGEGILSAVNTFADAVRGVNDAIGEMGGADAAISDVKAAVATVTAALASLAVVRNSSIRQTAQAVASEVQYTRAVASGNAVVLGSAEARRQQALATMEAAQATNAAAQAALADAQAQLRNAEARMQSAVTSRQVAQATILQAQARNAVAQAQERARVASANLAAAESRLGEATRDAANQATRSNAAAAAASTVWGRASTAIAAGATRVATAFKSLWAALGGGAGVAIMALVGGLTYLSTRQSDAEKAAELHTNALKDFEEATKSATDGTGKLVGKLTSLQKAQVELNKEKFMDSYKLQIEAIGELVENIVDKNTQISRIWSGDFSYMPPEFLATFEQMYEALKNGSMNAQDFRENLVSLRESLIESGYGADSLTKTIERLIDGEEGLANQLATTQNSIDRANEALGNSVNNVHEAAAANKQLENALNAVNEAQSTEIKDTKDAVEWLTKRTAQTETMTAVTEANSRAKDEAALKELQLAEAMAQLSLAAAISQAAMAQNTEEANKAVQAAAENLGKIMSLRAQFEKGVQDVYAGRTVKKSGGGASQIESARQSLARLREEIDQLNGTASKEGGALQKKLADIEKMGKTAKMSAAEIKALKDEYAAAFKFDTLKDFEEAVLQIEGNASALRELEINKTLTEWGLRFADLGMSADEAAPHLERLKNALQMQDSYKDLQTVADFYKELADMSGEYGQSIEYQNQLIDRQRQLWIEAGIPLADVDKRVELMRQELSKDMFAGAVRGARKFGAEYGDMAAQVEGFTQQMGSTISNTLADAFMTSKFSAYDFFNSLISYAAQAASNAFIGQIFGGLGGVFGGLFSGGGYVGMAESAVSAIPGFAGVFHSGGVVGAVPADGFRALPASAFAGAPRFHNGGGLGADEYPAVLLRGERVLNREETRAYNAGQASVAMPSVSVNTAPPNIAVNVINQTGQSVNAQTETRQDANGNLSLDIILQQVDKGMAGLAKSGKSQFGAYLQKSYGLSKANTLMQGRGRS